MRRKDTTKHDASCLVLQAVFFVVCIFFLAQGVMGEEMRTNGWFYFYTVGGWFGLGLIFFAITRGRFRHFLILVFMMVNSFIVPCSAYSCGAPAQIAALVGACYIIGVIVLATNDVALGAFIASAAFALTFHKMISGPDVEHTTMEYVLLLLAYLGLVAVSIGWRVVITRLYLLVQGKAPPGHVTEEEFDEVDEENQKFRKRIAAYIVEMNRLTGQESSLGKEQ